MGLENPIHWMVVLAIALIVLGPKRLPEAGRSLGHGIREFKNAMTGEREKLMSHLDADDEPRQHEPDPDQTT